MSRSPRSRPGAAQHGGVSPTTPEGPLALAPAATGTPTPAWRRPRFAVGILLVGASVALGSWAVDRAGSGVAAWAAARDLSPGDVVTAEDLRPVRLAWDGDPSTYLAEPPPEGAVAVSFVGRGELVPASAVGVAEDVDGRPVTVPLGIGTQVRAGVLVDLWAVHTKQGSDGDPTPVMLAESVLVLGTEQDTSLLGADEVARVLVPADVVPLVLAAQASNAVLTLVEHPGG